MFRRDRLLRFLTIATLSLMGVGAQAVPDFEKDVAPILEEACLFCHNQAEAKGDLDMSTKKASMSFDYLIVPGKWSLEVNRKCPRRQIL